jgi:NitT/TauT family transport system ATP-binding protein
MDSTIIEIKHVCKAFRQNEQQQLLVLDDVNFDIHEGEIVALLGKSGSGKSTLLRILAGLSDATKGTVMYAGQQVTSPVRGLSMVFQHFALMPWLTVLENVELGLAALGMARNKRRERALQSIDTVGLDGFESAYPKELSGGMCQRVGLARALVVEPDVLLMDEPFSALDILTAENLRGDLMDLWLSKKTNLKSILLVTHNIEEAAMMADRILVFGHNPGVVRAEIDVMLPQPRDNDSVGFNQIVEQVYGAMTAISEQQAKQRHFKSIGLGYRLPKITVSELTGFMESLAEYEGTVDLPDLAEDLHLHIDDLFPVTEALEILRFATISSGDITLTDTGKMFAEADILQRKQFFASHLLNHIPLARHIRRVLDERPGHRAKEERFISELEDYFSNETAEEVLTVAIDWGRYAEIFAYDYNSGILSLENPS